MLPVVIIPAYKPCSLMTETISGLKNTGFDRIVVVDDGSGSEYAELFETAQRQGCTVLRHAINLGKGRALKTAFNFIASNYMEKEGVVTVDADGQHRPEDALKVALELKASPDSLILGSRTFAKDVPMRSRLGNNFMSWAFALVNGVKIGDTQTGLRALPGNKLAAFLPVAGERYEFEMNMLLYAKQLGLSLREIPITTVYINNNSGSHFNPVMDSLRIFSLLIKFLSSSLMSFVVDYALFSLLTVLLPDMLFVNVAGARVCSSLFNYYVNKKLVFGSSSDPRSTLIKYALLVAFIMCMSYLLTALLSKTLGVNVYLSKIVSDTLLYFVSFFAQRELVFKKK